MNPRWPSHRLARRRRAYRLLAAAAIVIAAVALAPMGQPGWLRIGAAVAALAVALAAWLFSRGPSQTAGRRSVP